MKNEARNLPWVLPPIFDAVQHVLLVDNGSDDGTLEVAAPDRRGVRREPTASPASPTRTPVARAGGEHLATPATSVHSLTHFYNWCFSHVRTSYSMKWDGDMVLTPEGAGILRDLAVAAGVDADDRGDARGTRSPSSTSRTGWLDLSLRFLEPWVYPMGPDFTFVKAFDWELREYPAAVERLVLQQGLCVEVKWLDADEYAHWRTEGVDFTHTRLYRKLREFEVDEAIRSGRAEALGGLVRVDAPAGRPHHRPRHPHLAASAAATAGHPQPPRLAARAHPGLPAASRRPSDERVLLRSSPRWLHLPRAPPGHR